MPYFLSNLKSTHCFPNIEWGGGGWGRGGVVLSKNIFFLHIFFNFPKEGLYFISTATRIPKTIKGTPSKKQIIQIDSMKNCAKFGGVSSHFDQDCLKIKGENYLENDRIFWRRFVSFRHFCNWGLCFYN